VDVQDQEAHDEGQSAADADNGRTAPEAFKEIRGPDRLTVMTPRS
jgi:hypothetical protein